MPFIDSASVMYKFVDVNHLKSYFPGALSHAPASTSSPCFSSNDFIHLNDYKFGVAELIVNRAMSFKTGSQLVSIE